MTLAALAFLCAALEVRRIHQWARACVVAASLTSVPIQNGKLLRRIQKVRAVASPALLL